MVIWKGCLLAALLTIAQGNSHGHHGGCPFLAKVVPQGSEYMDIATELLHLRVADCSAFAQKFSGSGNFSFMHHTVTSQAEIEAMCKRHSFPQGASPPTLEGVFPAFSESDMLVEAMHMHGGVSRSSLARLHFCRKTKQITKAKVLSGDSLLNLNRVPEQMRQNGDRFLKQIFEHNDCGVYGDLVENDATVEFNGNAYFVTKGRESQFGSASQAASVCEENARRAKRVQISNTVAVKRYYYDDDDKELTLIADRSVEVIFNPGNVKTHPIAVALQFSSGGKIKAIRFYETEVLHIEKKWGSTYGAPKAVNEPSQHEGPSKVKAGVVMPKNVAPEASSKEGPPVPQSTFVDVLSGVSAARSTVSASWGLMVLLAFSVVMEMRA